MIAIYSAVLHEGLQQQQCSIKSINSLLITLNFNSDLYKQELNDHIVL